MLRLGRGVQGLWVMCRVLIFTVWAELLNGLNSVALPYEALTALCLTLRLLGIGCFPIGITTDRENRVYRVSVPHPGAQTKFKRFEMLDLIFAKAH